MLKTALRALSPDRSLMARLVGSFLTVSLLSLLLVALIAFSEARSALRGAVEDRLHFTAAEREAQLNRWVDRHRRSILFLSRLPELRSDAAVLAGVAARDRERHEMRRRIELLLKSVIGSLLEVEELFLLSHPGGEVIATTDARRRGDFRVNDLFYSRGGRETFVQNVYTSPVTGRPALTIATPVAGPRDETIAVLATHLDLAHVDRLIANRTGLGATGEAYLVSSTNDFVSSERFGRAEYRRGAFSEGILRALRGETGVGEYVNYAGVPVIGAFRWSGDRELALVVEMEQREAFAPARRLVWSILGIGLVSAFVLAGGVYLVALQIARPVLAITRAASDVSRGNFETVAPVMTGDEVGVLATAFNDMTARLRRLYADLNEQVEARTRAMVDLAESKQLLQAIIDNSTTLIAVTDREDRFLLLNQSFESVLGVPQAEALGKTPRDFLPPGAAREYLATAGKALKARRVAQCELSISREEGERRFLLVCFPLRSGTAEPYGVGAVGTDLTEIRRAQEEKEGLEAQVQHAQKLEGLGLMAGGIAHDFNNLLTGMLGNTELALERAGQDARSRSYLERVVAAIKRASELTTQMLAYAGKTSFRQETFDLNSLLDELTDLVKASVPKKIRFRVELDAQPAWIKANRAQSSQLVMNLITNAAEAVGDGPGWVLVSTRNLEGADRTGIALTVRDSGAGMEERTLARIFDPFFSTKGPGRGLGLAAVQGIVRSASGKLSVSSTLGEGSTFEVIFPPARNPIRERPAADSPEVLSGTGTVLVVDDEPVVRSVARTVLESAGFDVLEATNGMEGMEAYRARAGRIVAVLLDMTMPGLSGAEALRAIRAIDPCAPVILSSGYNERDGLFDLEEEEGVEFLQKPYRARTLLAKLRRVLQKSESARLGRAGRGGAPARG